MDNDYDSFCILLLDRGKTKPYSKYLIRTVIIVGSRIFLWQKTILIYLFYLLYTTNRWETRFVWVRYSNRFRLPVFVHHRRGQVYRQHNQNTTRIRIVWNYIFIFICANRNDRIPMVSAQVSHTHRVVRQDRCYW